MGMYGYICKHCGQSIRGGEIAHLIHVRHGEVLGECSGHYNSYGGVEENPIFDRWEKIADGSPNCHDEIMLSMFDLPDSAERTPDAIPSKLMDGKPVSFKDAMFKMYGTRSIFELPDRGSLETLRDEYEALPDNQTIVLPEKRKSGVVAYHEKCFCIAKKKNKIDLTPSEGDPNQSWGEPRKKFI